MLKILVDTREQRPWTFPADGFVTERATLPEGDYTMAGGWGRVALERKSLGDFVQTVVGQWIRFRKELIRLSGYDVAAVVVEADLSDVLQHKYESDADPVAVLGRANGIFLDHGIPVLWWGKRPGCELMAARFFQLTAAKLNLSPLKPGAD